MTEHLGHSGASQEDLTFRPTSQVSGEKVGLGQRVSRVPVMLSETDVLNILHAIYEAGVCERPSPNTMQKLRTALRRLNPDIDPDTLEARNG